MTLRKNLLSTLDPGELVGKLSKPTPELSKNLQDIQTPSLLHIAAQEGYLEAALWLLNAGLPIEQAVNEAKWEMMPTLAQQDAEKTPLYLAVERGHNLLAKCLLALGASQSRALNLAREFDQETVSKRLETKLQLDESILQALVFWSIKNYQSEYGTKMLERLLPQFPKDSSKTNNFMGAMIELATYYGHTQVVRKLLEQYPVRRDGTQCTAGYWAIVNHNPELYDLVCRDRASIVQTLEQTRLYRPQTDEIERYIERAPNASQPELRAKLSPRPTDLFVAPRLPPHLHTIYQKAATNLHISNLETAATSWTANDFTQMFIAAVDQMNYVLIAKLCAVKTNQHKQFFTAMTTSKDCHKQATLMVFTANIDMYQAALDYCKDMKIKNFLEQRFTLQGEETGLIHRLIKRSLPRHDHIATDTEKSLRSHLFARIPQSTTLPLTEYNRLLAEQNNRLTNTILRCLYDISFPTHKPFIEQLLNQPGAMQSRLAAAQNIPLPIKGLCAYYVGRFGQFIESSSESKSSTKKLSNHLLQEIFQWADPFDRYQIAEVNRRFSGLAYTTPNQLVGRQKAVRIHRKIYWYEDGISQLTARSAAIQGYLDAEQRYIDSRCCCQHQVKHNIQNLSFLLTFLLLIAALSVSSGYIILNATESDRIEGIIETTRVNGTDHYCSEYFYDLSFCRSKYVVPALCLALCDEYKNAVHSTTNTLSVFGAAFAALFTLLTIPLFYSENSRTLCQKRQRFDKFALGDFSPNVVASAQTMFRLAKNNFGGISVATSILDVRAAATAALDSTSALLANFRNNIKELNKELGLQETKPVEIEIKIDAPEARPSNAPIQLGQTSTATLFQPLSNSVSLLSTRGQHTQGYGTNDLHTPLISRHTSDHASDIGLDDLGDTHEEYKI